MAEQRHPLRAMLDIRSKGRLCGIPSYCTGNELVLEMLVQRAKQTNTPVLIEATANQCNQFGGYTGMKPVDFYKKVWDIAEKSGLPESYLILGGDHLGPLLWQDKPEAEAMALAEELVYQFALAGFAKLHLDTSMKLADDPQGPLSTETVARRGVRLYKACMRAYAQRLQQYPQALRPVFVIGSEVPIPGGAQESEEELTVTRSEDFENTMRAYERAFAEAGAAEGLNDVVAVVVQPGVEFGDAQVFDYKRENAAELCAALKKYPQTVFEGHSTDYQSKRHLREMVEDGIAILKVGPALTFSLREALFALSMMEKELVPAEEQAYLIEALERFMQEAPRNWQKYYHGSLHAQTLARKYSFSDRVRYYIGDARIGWIIEKLFDNLRRYPIPMNMLHQYMPLQYAAVHAGALENEPKTLALHAVAQVAQDYEFAARQNEGTPV